MGSEEKPNPVIPDLKILFSKILASKILKDVALFCGWIIGILVIAGLCWALSQPVRNRFLVRAANRALQYSGDNRRLGELPSSNRTPSNAMGAWYSVIQLRQSRRGTAEENFPEVTRAYVFTFIGEGTFFPCAAMLTDDGKVQELIPLNSHGARVLSRISPGIIKLYTRRIEGFEK